MPRQTLTKEIIIAAIDGFAAQRQRLDAQIAELRSMLAGDSTNATDTTGRVKGKRRKMSAAGRKAIAEAQRKRWAASKRQSLSGDPKTVKPKRRLSAAGKAAIVAALKKRWAAKRTDKKKASKT